MLQMKNTETEINTK